MTDINTYIHSMAINPTDGKPMPNAAVQLTGSNMELYGKSTDTKPTENIKVGATFFEIDTTNVYMWDGTAWRAI